MRDDESYIKIKFNIYVFLIMEYSTQVLFTEWSAKEYFCSCSRAANMLSLECSGGLVNVSSSGLSKKTTGMVDADGVVKIKYFD